MSQWHAVWERQSTEHTLQVPQAWRHLVRLWQYSCFLSQNLQCWILVTPVLLECVMRKLFWNQREKFLATAEESLKTWAECLVREDQRVFGSFGLESYHACGLEPGVAQLFWGAVVVWPLQGATHSRPAGEEWDSCSPSSWQEGLNAGAGPCSLITAVVLQDLLNLISWALVWQSPCLSHLLKYSALRPLKMCLIWNLV